jgi:hypothetical protein
MLKPDPDTVSSDRFAPFAESPFRRRIRPVNFGPVFGGGLLQATTSRQVIMASASASFMMFDCSMPAGRY